MLSLCPAGAPGTGRSNVRLAPPWSRWSLDGSPVTKRSVSTKYTALVAKGSVVPTYSTAPSCGRAAIDAQPVPRDAASNSGAANRRFLMATLLEGRRRRGGGREPAGLPLPQHPQPRADQADAADRQCLHRLAAEEGLEQEAEQAGRDQLRDHDEEIEDAHEHAHLPGREAVGQQHIRQRH